ncbi:MAG: SBBP repeat-containing protein, partial [Bacteroidota bacterium]
MKKNLLLFIIMLGTRLSAGQNVYFDWARQMGGSYFTYGHDIATDASGNVYTVGYFNGVVDFDPGPGTYNLTPVGATDIFVSKLDASGNFVWARQLGGPSTDYGYAVTVDASGNVYASGYFTTTADFDPGPSTYNLTSAGAEDIFVSKLNSSGNFLWARRLGGSLPDMGLSVGLDAGGNVLTTGYFQGTADFDPGPLAFNLISSGSEDVFISKLDGSGNFTWACQFGGAAAERGTSLVLDASGNVHTVGYFQGTADFDPGPGTLNLTSGGAEDIFISKLDASGNLTWTKQIGGTSSDFGRSITLDGSGNVHTTGSFQGTVDFDPNAGVVNRSSSGGDDIFVFKLSAAGNHVWSAAMGGTFNDFGASVAVDGSGNVLTTGGFQNTADFDPGPGNFFLITGFMYDIFVCKLNIAGNLVWAQQFTGGSGISDYSTAIALDASGNAHTTGYIESQVDFDPGPGTFNLWGQGAICTFASKLDATGNFVWARQLAGAVSSEFSNSIAVDPAGNVYTTGYFHGTADFNPGPGVLNFTSVNMSYDVYVSKLDASGNFIWARQLGGGLHDYGRSIAVDNMGNVFTTGIFSGTADFDPGPGVYNLNGGLGANVFISKLDAAGNFVWARQFSDAYGHSIAIDGSGNVYTTGYFQSTTDFDPGPGIFNLTAGGTADVFVSKLNAAGNFVWAVKMGSSTTADLAYSITLDQAGNVYTTGEFYGTADFDPGPSVFNLNSPGSFNVFVSKLTSAGSFVWAKGFGGPSTDKGYSIAVDAVGNVLTTGIFQGMADFDPGSGTFNMNSSSGTYFISKLDVAGNFTWAKQWSGSTPDYGRSVAVDNLGSVYVTGLFSGTSDLDPGPGVYSFTAIGLNDVFICKLNNAGTFAWAKQLGGITDDWSRSIAVDQTQNVYTTGFFGQVDFDPEPTSYYLYSAGVSDIFVHKMRSCNSVFSFSASACSSYTSPSGNYTWTSSGTYMDTIANSAGCDSILTINLAIGNSTSSISPIACAIYNSPSGNYNWNSSGVYYDTIPNFQGCDSVITINLTVNNNSTGSISVTACNSYISPSGNYSWTSSGVYSDTLTNFQGCDSIIAVGLTVINSTSSVISPSSCYSYTSPSSNYIWTTSGTYSDTLINSAGCDSIITINLTINGNSFSSQNVSACDSYTWLNTLYTVSGTYMDTIANSAGCDSVMTLNLTIVNVDTSLTLTVPTITSNAAGALYQWVDCNNGFAPLSGEINQSFTPTMNGNYAVIVTQNGCTDTSFCYSFLSVTAQENQSQTSIMIYPNPTQGSFLISFNSVHPHVNVRIT